jgi:hypothetical protein
MQFAVGAQQAVDSQQPAMDSPMAEKKHRNWADEVDEEDGTCSWAVVTSSKTALTSASAVLQA